MRSQDGRPSNKSACADLDDPITTERRRDSIRRNRLLYDIYRDWYRHITMSVPSGTGRVLEIGSGAGFLSECMPELITSDIIRIRHVQLILDAAQLPLGARSLRAIVMTNVFHHLNEPQRFLTEAARCVRPDGAIVMIEPWVSGWSQIVYRLFHHEPFDPTVKDWMAIGTGPLSGANGALPWIVFVRDRRLFEERFPEWTIERVLPMMPIRYILSGGFSRPCLAPVTCLPLVKWLERGMGPLGPRLAMFAGITLRRK